MKLKILIPFLIVTGMIYAEEKTYSAEKIIIVGQEYEEVSIKLSSPIYATISHSGGLRRIEAEYLSSEIQIAIGYNKQAAAAAETELQQKQAATVEAANLEAARAAKLESAVEHRYQVWENTDQHLIVFIYEQQTQTLHIPGGASRTGGGGGVTTSNKVWKITNKRACILHTTHTRHLPTDSIFTAKVHITGQTIRVSTNDVIPLHTLASDPQTIP